MASVPSNIPSSLTAGYSEFLTDNAAAANQYNDTADQLWADYLAFEKDYFDKYQASLDQYGSDLSGVDNVSVTMPDIMGGATVELAPKVHSAMHTDQLNARNKTIANQANAMLAGLGSRDALAKNRYGVDQTALANSLIPTTVGTELYKMERGGQLGIAQAGAGVYEPSTVSTWAPVVGTVLGSDAGQSALSNTWDFVTSLF